MVRRIKKRMTGLILGVLVLGGTMVFAADPYSFGFSEFDRIKYSAPYVKSIETESAYVRQTGSTPGTYTVKYLVKRISDDASMTLEKGISGTDYTTHTLLYRSGYEGLGTNTYLRGECISEQRILFTVNGEWNPNGLLLY